MTTAVALSLNTVAWQVYAQLTPEKGIEYLKRLGFSSITEEDEHQLAPSLGGFTYGVSPMEMAKGYAAIANDGIARQTTCINKITDLDGNVIWKNADAEKIRIYDKLSCRYMSDMLKGVTENGTASGLSVKEGKIEAGVKTGTTNESKDGWMCGFTPYYTLSVWVGCDQPEPVPGLYGGTYPRKIWEGFMNAACADKKKKMLPTAAMLLEKRAAKQRALEEAEAERLRQEAEEEALKQQEEENLYEEEYTDPSYNEMTGRPYENTEEQPVPETAGETQDITSEPVQGDTGTAGQDMEQILQGTENAQQTPAEQTPEETMLPAQEAPSETYEQPSEQWTDGIVYDEGFDENWENGETYNDGYTDYTNEETYDQ